MLASQPDEGKFDVAVSSRRLLSHDAPSAKPAAGAREVSTPQRRQRDRQPYTGESNAPLNRFRARVFSAKTLTFSAACLGILYSLTAASGNVAS